MIRSHSSSVMSAAAVARLFDAGVVEGEVQAPERVDRLVERRLHVLGPGDVASHGERPPAGSSIMRAVSWLPCSDTSATTTLGALARERQRRRASDAAARTGDERDLAGEASVCSSQPSSVLFVARLRVVVGWVMGEGGP